MLHQDLDDGLGIVDVVVGVELQFFKFGILADKVFNGVFETFHDLGQSRLVGWGLDVENDFVINSKLLGDRQGIG